MTRIDIKSVTRNIVKGIKHLVYKPPKEPFQLPIIDLSLSEINAEKLGEQIVHAFQETGFIFGDNIPNLDFDKLFECSEWFFSQPEEVKNSVMRYPWNQKNKNVYRGYFPVLPKEPNRFEGFEFAKDVPLGSVSSENWFYEPSVWPKEDGKCSFKDLLSDFYETMHITALDLLRLCAIGLNLPERYFDYMFADKPMSTVRLLHYPPWNGDPPENAKIEDGKIVAIEEHTDTEYLTLLTTFNYSGLEILNRNGKWVGIPARPNSLLINIGDTFARMMGGRFKSTRHRVIDIGVDRYSVAFFMTPAFDTDVGFDIMKKASGITEGSQVEHFGPFHLRKMKYEKKYVEFRDLPDIHSGYYLHTYLTSECTLGALVG